jgi:hypothetical protein
MDETIEIMNIMIIFSVHHRGKVKKRNANNSFQNHSTLTILSSASYDCVLFLFFADYFHITVYEQPKPSFSLILQFVNAV